MKRAGDRLQPGPQKRARHEGLESGIVSPANRALAEDFDYVYEVIPGAGHLLQIQKPEECRPAVLSFLAECGII